jgi:hypothetical protein
MRIKMKVHFAGSGFSAAIGDEIDRPDDEAIRLIRKNYAVPLGAMPVEAAVQPPPQETRVEPPALIPMAEIRKPPRLRKGKRG